jgi:uncharacterized membrane protein
MGELHVHRAADIASRNERSLGDLLKQLSTDTTDLMRQEVALAKAEVRQAGAALGADASKIGIAAGLAFAGAIAITAFLVTGLGALLDGKYWLSSLIVGVLFFLTGAALVRNAVADIKRRAAGLGETAQSLREDAAWAKRETREVKHVLTT